MGVVLALRVSDDWVAECALVGAPSQILPPAPSPPQALRAEPRDAALLLHTSGTTGRPKAVPLAHANLAASARNIAAFYGLRGADRSVLVMPLFHIHGLTGCVLTTLAAGASLALPEQPRMDAAATLKLLEGERATWVTAVPSVYQALLGAIDAGAPLQVADLRMCRSSSSPLAAATLTRVERALGAVVLEAYSMSEASHQMTSNPPPPEWGERCARTGQRRPGSVGVSAGAAVAIFPFLKDCPEGSSAPARLPVGGEGEVCVCGSSVFDGYRDGPPEKEVFVVVGAEERWFRTGDRGVLDGDGFLTLTGRLKELVNVGGIKVAPTDVDSVLLEHEAVAAAAAFAWPDEHYGEVVGAAIVLRAKAEAPGMVELRAHCARALSAAKVPARVWVLDAIPKTATGKIQRSQLPHAVGGRGSLPERSIAAAAAATVAAAGAAHTDEITELVRQAWVRVLPPGSSPSVSDLWATVGGNSLIAQRLLRELVTLSGVALTAADLYDSPSIQTQAATIKALRRRQDGGMPAAMAVTARASRASAGAAARRPATRQQLDILLSETQLRHGEQRRSGLLLAITGVVEMGALRRALQRVVARHSALRTRFERTADGRLMQRVDALQSTPAVPLRIVNARGRQASLDASLAKHVASCTFDLMTGPLLSALLVRMSPGDHVLSVGVHHAIFDNWSADIFRSELAAAYAAEVGGGADVGPSRDDLPQYHDFARESESETTPEASLVWWAGYMDGAFPSPRLGRLCRIGGASRESAEWPGAHKGRLAGEMASALRAAGQALALPVHAIAHAATHILLHRLCATPDTVVGVVHHGRDRALDYHDAIGCFAAVVPSRLRIEEGESCAVLARRALDSFHGAVAHACSLKDIVQQCEVDAPELLSCVFNYKPCSAPAVAGNVRFQDAPDDLKMDAELGDRVPNADVQITVSEVYAGDAAEAPLDVRMHFDTEYISEEYGLAIYSAYVDLLDTLAGGALAKAPEQALPEAALPDFATATAAAVTGASDNRAPWPQDGVCVALWSGTADSEACALVQGDPQEKAFARLSHADLAHRATLLGRLLRQRGVVTGALVATAAARCPELVVAWVAVALEGACAVVLDPVRSPPARIAALLDSVCPIISLARRGWREWETLEAAHALCAHAAPPLVDLHVSAQQGVIAGGRGKDAVAEAHASARLIASNELAHVCFTSGTTGLPKGVCAEHRHVTNFVHFAGGDTALGGWLGLKPGSSIFSSCATSFDPALQDVWCSLVHGTALVLWDESVEPALDVVRHSCTHSLMTPTLLAVAMASVHWPAAARCLQVVATTGEAAPLSLVRRVLARGGGTRCINLYGPTETTFEATMHDFAKGDHALVAGAARSHVGSPLPNYQVQIVDSQCGLIGSTARAGEVLIGGASVSRGYLRSPELTQEKFVQPTWGKGSRWYRTGDVGRWELHASGGGASLDVFGRLDDQVKLSGQRINMSEVQAACLQCRGVEGCAVALREEPSSGHGCLVAYIVSQGGGRISRAVMKHARAALPSHAVPRAVVVLPTLPTTASGKVDAKSLPEPDWALAHSPAAAGRDARASTTADHSVIDGFAGSWDVGLGMRSRGGGGGIGDRERVGGRWISTPNDELTSLSQRAALSGMSSLEMLQTLLRCSKRDLAVIHMYGLGVFFMSASHVCLDCPHTKSALCFESYIFAAGDTTFLTSIFSSPLQSSFSFIFLPLFFALPGAFDVELLSSADTLLPAGRLLWPRIRQYVKLHTCLVGAGIILGCAGALAVVALPHAQAVVISDVMGVRKSADNAIAAIFRSFVEVRNLIACVSCSAATRHAHP